MAKVVFSPGEPVGAILESVKQNGIDLLILGALQRENFLKYYIGSIARKITRKASCSVMLLINPSIEQLPCKHIVVNGLEDEKTPATISAAFFVAQALSSEKITIVDTVWEKEISLLDSTTVDVRFLLSEEEEITINNKTIVALLYRMDIKNQDKELDQTNMINKALINSSIRKVWIDKNSESVIKINIMYNRISYIININEN